MEISNMLRADLNRVVSDGFRAGGGDGAAAAERAEREVAARYDAKLADIESSMRELVAQNRALKDELRRWTAADGFEPPPRPRPTPASAACAAAAADGPSAFGGGAGDEDDDDPTSAGAAERAFQRAAARRATSANSSARSRLAAGGSALYDAQDAPRMRAREKLEEAKSSLQLAGSSAPRLGERPPSVPQTARATPSQNSARLTDIQRKRSELVKRRSGVRNWNERSPEGGRSGEE